MSRRRILIRLNRGLGLDGHLVCATMLANRSSLMAKAKNPKKKIGGPFVAAAVLCNSVSEDADGVVSALRIVDEIRGVLSPDAPADFPSKSNPLEINLFALIIVTSQKHRT